MIIFVLMQDFTVMVFPATTTMIAPYETILCDDDENVKWNSRAIYRANKKKQKGAEDKLKKVISTSSLVKIFLLDFPFSQ